MSNSDTMDIPAFLRRRRDGSIVDNNDTVEITDEVAAVPETVVVPVPPRETIPTSSTRPATPPPHVTGPEMRGCAAPAAALPDRSHDILEAAKEELRRTQGLVVEDQARLDRALKTVAELEDIIQRNQQRIVLLQRAVFAAQVVTDFSSGKIEYPEQASAAPSLPKPQNRKGKKTVSGAALAAPASRIPGKIRKIATELNVDLSRVRPTGPKGGITIDDVVAASGASRA